MGQFIHVILQCLRPKVSLEVLLSSWRTCIAPLPNTYCPQPWPRAIGAAGDFGLRDVCTVPVGTVTCVAPFTSHPGHAGSIRQIFSSTQKARQSQGHFLSYLADFLRGTRAKSKFSLILTVTGPCANQAMWLSICPSGPGRVKIFLYKDGCVRGHRRNNAFRRVLGLIPQPQLEMNAYHQIFLETELKINFWSFPPTVHASHLWIMLKCRQILMQ